MDENNYEPVIPDVRVEISDTEADENRSRDSMMLMRGIIVGFGLAAVLSMFFNLFREQHERRRSSLSDDCPDDYSDEGEKIRDISSVMDESANAFRDAVDVLDRTFESGRQVIESIGEVIDKIRQ